ncbi:MAG: hypothetical protein ACQEWV_14675 [Bacillota bacterium]
MSDWNEQAAPNNNLPAKSIRSSNLLLDKKNTTKNKSYKHSPDNKK